MRNVKKSAKKRFYIVISPDLLQRLNENWIEIRRLSTSSVSKSVIVEEALKAAFAEFDLKQEQSQLYVNVSSIKKEAYKKRGQDYKKEQPEFSMSPQTIKEAYEYLEHFRSLSKNAYITMKRMVEEALKIVFDEFELKKEESEFYLTIFNLEETQHSIKHRKINYGPRRRIINLKSSTGFLEQLHRQIDQIQKLCGRKLKTSSIAEESIKIALEDFDFRKENSYLCLKLNIKEEKESKVKKNVSVSINLAQLIQKKWLEIRKMLNRKIPLSKMVEKSIQFSLDEFELRKEESQIYKRICPDQKRFSWD